MTWRSLKWWWRYRRPVRINWGWMQLRWQHTRYCPGTWTAGDRKGHRACNDCGVWLWNPTHVRLRLGDPG